MNFTKNMSQQHEEVEAANHTFSREELFSKQKKSHGQSLKFEFGSSKFKLQVLANSNYNNCCKQPFTDVFQNRCS